MNEIGYMCKHPKHFSTLLLITDKTLIYSPIEFKTKFDKILIFKRKTYIFTKRSYLLSNF